MSTTFEVYPTTEIIPTFNQLLSLSSRHLSEFLQSYGIKNTLRLDVGMRAKMDETNQELPIDLDGPAWWPKESYAWFFFQGVSGGTDAYANKLDELHRDCLNWEATRDNKDWVGDLLPKTLTVGKRWCFRRSAGQPAIINLAYGIIAASLTELTGGFLHSADSAWDYRLLPARPDEFLRWYFRPELATNADKQSWSQRCIKAISLQFKN